MDCTCCIELVYVYCTCCIELVHTYFTCCIKLGKKSGRLEVDERNKETKQEEWYSFLQMPVLMEQISVTAWSEDTCLVRPDGVLNISM